MKNERSVKRMGKNALNRVNEIKQANLVSMIREVRETISDISKKDLQGQDLAKLLNQMFTILENLFDYQSDQAIATYKINVLHQGVHQMVKRPDIAIIKNLAESVSMN